MWPLIFFSIKNWVCKCLIQIFLIVLLKLLTAHLLWRWYFPPSTLLIPLFSCYEDNVFFTILSIIGMKHWRVSNYECLCYMISNCLCFLSLIGNTKPYLLKLLTIVKRYGYLLSSVILKSISTLSAWYRSYHKLYFIYLIILNIFLMNEWMI